MYLCRQLYTICICAKLCVYLNFIFSSKITCYYVIRKYEIKNIRQNNFVVLFQCLSKCTNICVYIIYILYMYVCIYIYVYIYIYIYIHN